MAGEPGVGDLKLIQGAAAAIGPLHAIRGTGDDETAKLARGYRREEERMVSFLEKQIPVLTREVARQEIPSNQRKTPRRRKRKRSG